MNNQEGMYQSPQQREQEEQYEPRVFNTDPREQSSRREESYTTSNYEEGYGYRPPTQNYEEGYNSQYAQREKINYNYGNYYQKNNNLPMPVIIGLIIAAVIILNIFIRGGFAVIFTIAIIAGAVYFYTQYSKNKTPQTNPINSGSPRLTPRFFNVQEHARLHIKNPIGSIQVLRGEDHIVEVSGTQKEWFSTGKALPQNLIETNQIGNDIIVNTNSQTSLLSHGSNINLVIRAPRNSNLVIEGNAGTILVDGIAGEMTIETNAGTIDVRQAVLMGRSRLQTNAGTITFDGSLDPHSENYLESNVGSVSVTLSTYSSLIIKASSDLGSIKNAFGSTKIGEPPYPMLDLRTNLGSIDIRHR